MPNNYTPSSDVRTKSKPPSDTAFTRKPRTSVGDSPDLREEKGGDQQRQRQRQGAQGQGQGARSRGRGGGRGKTHHIQRGPCSFRSAATAFLTPCCSAAAPGGSDCTYRYLCQ